MSGASTNSFAQVVVQRVVWVVFSCSALLWPGLAQYLPLPLLALWMPFVAGIAALWDLTPRAGRDVRLVGLGIIVAALALNGLSMTIFGD